VILAGDCLRTSADIVGYVRRSRRARKARFFASLRFAQNDRHLCFGGWRGEGGWRLCVQPHSPLRKTL